MGSREANNAKAKAWAAETGPAASTGSFAEAAQFAELAVLCIWWSGTENALRMAGAQNLTGKVLIDATNPLVFPPGAPPALALDAQELHPPTQPRRFGEALPSHGINRAAFAES